MRIAKEGSSSLKILLQVPNNILHFINKAVSSLSPHKSQTRTFLQATSKTHLTLDSAPVILTTQSRCESVSFRMRNLNHIYSSPQHLSLSAQKRSKRSKMCLLSPSSSKMTTSPRWKTKKDSVGPKYSKVWTGGKTFVILEVTSYHSRWPRLLSTKVLRDSQVGTIRDSLWRCDQLKRLIIALAISWMLVSICYPMGLIEETTTIQFSKNKKSMRCSISKPLIRMLKVSVAALKKTIKPNWKVDRERRE